MWARRRRLRMRSTMRPASASATCRYVSSICWKRSCRLGQQEARGRCGREGTAEHSEQCVEPRLVARRWGLAGGEVNLVNLGGGGPLVGLFCGGGAGDVGRRTGLFAILRCDRVFKGGIRCRE